MTLPAAPEPTVGRVLNPAHYKDSCDHCIQVTADRSFFVATPYQLEPSPRGGLVARYRHACGMQWWTSWQIKTAA